MYIVREITGEKGWKDFLSVPYLIYRDDRNWIPPQKSEIRRVLDTTGNPYFANALLKMYVCYEDEKPVSRAVMVLNRLFPDKWGKKAAFFGFFESVNDIRAAECLFKRIESDVSALGGEYLEGPFNPNHYSELGILTSDFEESPMFFETYNPGYYEALLTRAGFRELCGIHTRINRNMPATVSKISERLKSGPQYKNIRVRKFNILKMGRDLEIMREINNDAFGGNWYFLPLSNAEYRFSARFMFLVTSPSMIIFVEHKGKPVGVLQLVINVNPVLKSYRRGIMPWDLPVILLKRRSVSELVIFTIAIRKAYQRTGVIALMMESAIKILRNYRTVSTTWISDGSKGVSYLSDLFGLEPYKQFKVFTKKLNGEKV